MKGLLLARGVAVGVAVLAGLKGVSLLDGFPSAWSRTTTLAFGSAQAAAPNAPATPLQRGAPLGAAPVIDVPAPPPAGESRHPPAPSPQPPASPAAVDADQQDVAAARARREALEERERAMITREALLAAAERRLTTRITELTSLQSALEARERAVRDREESSWAALAKLYEDMRPRDAAAVLNELDMPVLVELVHRMGGRKAASVLAAMQPDRVRQLTVELARLRGAVPSAAGTPTSPRASNGR